MNELIKHFPREVAVPYRIKCETEQDFFRVLDRYNGKRKKIYFSVYDCSEDIKIDKIAFDLDSKKSLGNLIKLHKWCMKYDYKHLMIFSTGGFWCYVFTKNYNKLQDKKGALANAQDYICEKVGLTIYDRNEKGVVDPYINDVDFHLIGDIRRVGRMPNTLDKVRGIFAIPLQAADLYTGIDHIKAKAKKQCFKYVYYGNKYFDIGKYDGHRKSSIPISEMENYTIDLSHAEKIITLFPPCVQCWLMKPEMGTWEARFNFAVFCRDFGISKESCDALAKKYFTKAPRKDGMKNNYEHFIKVKALSFAYSTNTLFPDCDTLALKGLCPKKCKHYNNLLYQ